MSDEGIKARLVAAREELGMLELEGMRAIQSAQRCIARGVPVYGVEVAALEALIEGMRAALEAAWDLAAHELDVASGRRRAGWAA